MSGAPPGATAVLLALAVAVAACAPARAPGSGDEANAIAAVHAAKCGACHALPRPRTRSRAYLEEALARHRKRVHLGANQWQALVDYLARPDAGDGGR